MRGGEQDAQIACGWQEGRHFVNPKIWQICICIHVFMCGKISKAIILQVVKRSEERPTLRSVANAIRTGIFIEKIYRRMSKSQMMAIPEAVEQCLQVISSPFKTSYSYENLIRSLVF